MILAASLSERPLRSPKRELGAFLKGKGRGLCRGRCPALPARLDTHATLASPQRCRWHFPQMPTKNPREFLGEIPAKMTRGPRDKSRAVSATISAAVFASRSRVKISASLSALPTRLRAVISSRGAGTILCFSQR